MWNPSLYNGLGVSNTNMTQNIIVYFSYYLVLESLFSLTTGKFFNKVRVVTIEKEKPTFGQVLLRSIMRLIPFGFIIFYTPHNRALHDLLSNTWVGRIKKS